MILDNGTTHAPKQLERWLKEQIEIRFSILQRRLLQSNHFERLGNLRQTIVDFIAYYSQTAKPIQWSYTVEKLEQKLGTN